MMMIMMMMIIIIIIIICIVKHTFTEYDRIEVIIRTNVHTSRNMKELMAYP